MKIQLTIVLTLLSLFARNQTTPDLERPCGGISRWSVKTMSDPAAKEIDSIATQSTIGKLIAIKRPECIGRTTPRLEQEKRLYVIHCKIVHWFKEADGDLHLVCEDTNTKKQMICELSSPLCLDVQHGRFYIQKERTWNDFVSQKKGEYDKPLFIIGVFYFDLKHGMKPRGCAPNEAELRIVKIIKG